MPSFLSPKRPLWARSTAIVAAASLGVFAIWAWWTPWRPGRFGGLLFGTMASLLFLNDAAYPFRRRLMSWPLGSALRWLQLHVYGGLLACLFVWIHTGFRLPTGALGWWLFALTLWTTVTGVVGVVIQKWVPNALASNLSVEAIYERIPELLSRLPSRADELMREGSDTLTRVYLSDVRPSFSTSPQWSTLLDMRGYRERSLEPLVRVRAFIPEADRDRIAGLEAIVAERVELEAHRGAQRLMRAWLIAHVPPAIVLTGLMVVHVLAVWYL